MKWRYRLVIICVLCLALVIYRLNFDQTAYITGDVSAAETKMEFPKMQADDARAFLSFIYNDNVLSANYSKDEFYLLLTGQLEGGAKEELNAIAAFVEFVQANMNSYIENAEYRQNYLSDVLLDYMYYLYNSECNDFFQTQFDNLTEIIEKKAQEYYESYIGTGTVSYLLGDLRSFKTVVSGLASLPEDIEKYVRTAVASTALVLSPLQGELKGRYTYFNLYLDVRESYSPDSDVFETIMEYNKFALADNSWWQVGIMKCLPGNMSWLDHTDTIDRWAENYYQIIQYQKKTYNEETGKENKKNIAGIENSISQNVFIDKENNRVVSQGYADIYSNGSMVKNIVNGKSSVKQDYKQRVYYTSVLPPNLTYMEGKKKKTIGGKLVVGITLNSEQPILMKGKIVDTEAKKIATASYSKSKGTITVKAKPNASGTVYLWVIGHVNAKGIEKLSDTVGYVKITVKTAPTNLSLYNISSSDVTFVHKASKQYKKDTINVEESISIYLYPNYKMKGKVLKAEGATYTAEVDKKVADYFEVLQDEANPECFIVTAKGLKNGKKVSGKITIKCCQNGKKAVFKATAVRTAQEIKITELLGVTEHMNGSELVIKSSTEQKVTGTFKISAICAEGTVETTDSPKLYAMAVENGFDAEKMKEGRVVITAKPSKMQKKLKASLGRDKSTVTVTAAQSTPVETTVYYLIVYNTKNDNAGCGYKVIRITVRE